MKTGSGSEIFNTPSANKILSRSAAKYIKKERNS